VYRLVGKRAFDVVGASIALYLLSPILCVIAVCVRLAHGSPVVFTQQRVGLGGHIFTIYKFRTMTEARDSNGALMPDSARVTRLGRLLRSSSLDELPELINVITGDMSLIGPRPLLAAYRDRYSETQMRRHEVRPGITGWAQIHGRNTLSWEEKFQHDVFYVDHVRLRFDLAIAVLTVWKMIRREGINQSEEATMQEFMGLDQ
jgi:sugar transferase EpsL